MKDILINFLSNYSYWGIFFLIMIENLFPPIPSELILTFGGFLIWKMGLSYMLVLFSSTTGSVVGAILLYWIGTKIQIEKLEILLNNNLIKKLGFKEGDIKKTFKWFEKYEGKSVFIGRCVPVVRSLISIPAGINHMPLKKFLIYTTIGSTIWNIFLITVGNMAGNSWEAAGNLFYGRIKIIVVVIVIVFIVYKFISKKKIKN